MTFVGILTVYILESETSNLWYIIQNMSTLNLLKVNTDTGVLLSAGISKTGLYDPTDANSIEQCEEAYKVSLRYHQILFPFSHFAVTKCKKYYQVHRQRFNHFHSIIIVVFDQGNALKVFSANFNFKTYAVTGPDWYECRAQCRLHQHSDNMGLR